MECLYVADYPSIGIDKYGFVEKVFSYDEKNEAKPLESNFCSLIVLTN